MSPDSAITWPMLATLFGILAPVLAGLWAIHGAVKKQFEQTNQKSEDRAVRTHQRIDQLREDIHETYTPREVHAAEVRRLDEAMHERDRQIEDLNGRLECPGPARRGRRAPS